MVAFGALVAAGIPLLLALTAVIATFGLVAVTSQAVPIATQAGALVLLIGLAVGVDYSLVYLRRAREERAKGRNLTQQSRSPPDLRPGAVLISGLTVMTAMAGMFLTGDPVFASFAVATIAVVAIAMLGSLTVLPALLSRLGDKVDRGQVPFLGRRRRDGEGRVWGAIVDRVLRRPALSAVLAGGLLVALAVPALQLRMMQPGPDTFPESLPAVQTYQRMRSPSRARRFRPPWWSRRRTSTRPRCRRPSGGSSSGPSQAAACTSRSQSTSTRPVRSRASTSRSRARSRRRLERVLAVLRDEIVPNTVGALPDAEAGVTGFTAQWKTRPTRCRRFRSSLASCSCSPSASCSPPSGRP